MPEMTVSTKLNGVDVDRLFETVAAIKQTTQLAHFKFELQNRWIDCGQNTSTIENFYGAGQDHRHKAPFVLNADEPAVLLGGDSAPNPAEYLMHALVTCVTTSLVYHAAAKGIRLQEVESRAEGEIDLRGFLGLDESVRRGFKALSIKFRIKADVPDEQLEELCQLGPTYSPVFDSLTRGVPVEVSLDK